jgi:hypothetical protein
LLGARKKGQGWRHDAPPAGAGGKLDVTQALESEPNLLVDRQIGAQARRYRFVQCLVSGRLFLRDMELLDCGTEL